jgi:hypothetical protein
MDDRNDDQQREPGMNERAATFAGTWSTIAAGAAVFFSGSSSDASDTLKPTKTE